ncbi:hypothetical protein [Collinsella sp. AM15-2]|uniref:hypothetical protein n=1 Tax=Collinsella sp. AM15-2 TaxID=2292025 RepID=UPI001314662C|nr:hypothetical protein [Collinsella sp. AM15-2]
MSKNIVRLAVTAGLTAALSFGGVMAPVTMAFAAGTPTVATEKGKVAITDETYTGARHSRAFRSSPRRSRRIRRAMGAGMARPLRLFPIFSGLRVM